MDQIRFAVEPVPEDGGSGFEVQVFVNDVEMTSAGAGLGMDPSDLLIPVNRLRPVEQRDRVAIARCDCGIYGCGSTDIRITAQDDVVHWDWLEQKPMKRRVTFDRAAYLAEVDRLESDRSWETEERVVIRLIARAARSPSLQARGLSYGFAGNDEDDRNVFNVSFVLDNSYQVFLRYRWAKRTPKELAAKITSSFHVDPRSWDATWYPLKPAARDRVPAMAGPAWRQSQFP